MFCVLIVCTFASSCCRNYLKECLKLYWFLFEYSKLFCSQFVISVKLTSVMPSSSVKNSFATDARKVASSVLSRQKSNKPPNKFMRTFNCDSSSLKLRFYFLFGFFFVVLLRNILSLSAALFPSPSSSESSSYENTLI